MGGLENPLETMDMLVFFTNLRLREFQVGYLVLFLIFSVTNGFGWFWMGSLHKNIQLILEFLKAPFLVLQEMPSQQQKSTKKDAQDYLISRPNHISVNLRMGVALIRKRLQRFLQGNSGWLLYEEIWIVTKSVKIKK